MSNATPNFDNLLLQSLTRRLHLNSPPPFSQSLEHLRLNLSEFDTDTETNTTSSSSVKTQLFKEESKLEKEIIRTILAGGTEKLKPNSGQAVAVGDHHICVGFHVDIGSGYRVWEWHGHIVLFGEQNGYDLEYIYGNYFETLSDTTIRELESESSGDHDDVGDDDEKVGNVGLKEVFESYEPDSRRVIHRNLNANSWSSRFI